MIDIFFTENGKDLSVYNTQVERAKNILSTQLNALEYAQGFGIDIKYFLDENYRFQNESFRAYLIERLASNGINVSSVINEIEALSQSLTINLTPPEDSGGLVAR